MNAGRAKENGDDACLVREDREDELLVAESLDTPTSDYESLASPIALKIQYLRKSPMI